MVWKPLNLRAKTKNSCWSSVPLKTFFLKWDGPTLQQGMKALYPGLWTEEILSPLSLSRAGKKFRIPGAQGMGSRGSGCQRPLPMEATEMSSSESITSAEDQGQEGMCPSPQTRPSLVNLPETFPRVSSNKLILEYQVCFLGCGPAKVGIQAFPPLFI